MNGYVDGRKLRFEHRRGEVLRAATEHALDHGLAGLSLRKVAQTVGVSHATLVHHFSTKDQLVAEIVDLVLTQSLALPDLADDDPEPLGTIWRRATSDQGRRYIRLFTAITGHAMHDNPMLRDAVARSMQQRTALLAAGLVRHGCPEPEAVALATSLLSTLRGLLVDLLVTDDEKRVRAAFDDLATELDRRSSAWPTPGAGPTPAGS
ncbi:TetR/AcrR family transcriptional regulator [Promicromonospora iranensis]|uniref:AcrR family transcriptional regulator n=1 Tax=Promicromonospora iranensis TaxID=1105144 RepID=A0ABU2CKD6_9MICO|nr:TetR/AcrR family transcriptional regulator [Promicromonospora iranensis]MDR7381802.1 AcrR family transcriptional regulator [Promicromonospora iranensis]